MLSSYATRDVEKKRHRDTESTEDLGVSHRGAESTEGFNG
jgi:hypothetical protein